MWPVAAVLDSIHLGKSHMVFYPMAYEAEMLSYAGESHKARKKCVSKTRSTHLSVDGRITAS